MEFTLSDIGNPWDNMSYVDKKRFGLHYYYTFIVSHPEYGFHTDALCYAANMVRVSPRTIHTWVTELEGGAEMKGDGRGRHSKTASPMEDPEFCAKLREYVKVSTYRQLYKMENRLLPKYKEPWGLCIHTHKLSK